MIDMAIVACYLVLTIIIGIYYGKNTDTIEDYAIGRKDFSTSALVAAISATMISAAGTSGLSGKVYSFGIIYALSFCFGSVISRMVVAFFIAPKMEKFLDLISSGDVLERLYGTKAKILMGVLVLIEGPLLAAAQIFATYKISQYFFGISQNTAAVITSAVIVLYCFRGGIRAVSYTDVFQFIVLIIAIPIVTALAIERVGGFSTLIIKAENANLLFSGLSQAEIFKHVVIFSSLSLTSIFPLTLQRMLMAKNTKQIRNSFFFNGVVTLPFYLLIGILGISAALLLPGIDANFALPAIADSILPVGIKGLVIAGIIAIFMSSADSQMNVTTVAVTQDLLRPILKEKLTPSLIIIFARITFIFSGILATAIALFASNALDLLFIVMVICNSIYFPGYFVGILGFKPSRTAFWIGASSGAIVAFTLSVIFKAFPLYGMLSAIAVNMSCLMASHYAKNIPDSIAKLKEFFFPPSGQMSQEIFFELKLKSISIANTSYCDAYSFIALISSLLPFFFHWSHLNNQSWMLPISYIVGAVFSLLLILRQTTKFIEKNLFTPMWHATIYLNLTLQSALIFSSNGSIMFWVADIITVTMLFYLLTRRQDVIIHLLAYGLTAAAAIVVTSPTARDISLQFAYYPFLSHVATLVICLIMLRQRDIAAYHFMATKLAHEAGRSITSFSSSAGVLQSYLPILIENYNFGQTNADSSFSKSQLKRLAQMPSKLIETSNRSQEMLKQMLMWMEMDKAKTSKGLCFISQVVKNALNDNSFSDILRKKIELKQIDNFVFLGSRYQISQVIINILENAHHATAHTAEPKIMIWSDETSLYIEDNGTGISKSDQPNVFDQFFSTKGTSGQGLAFCKLIMENHGGSISCESKQGAYTRFKLSFPDSTPHNLGDINESEHTSNS